MPEAAKHHKSARAHGESPEKTCRRGHPWLRDKYDRCIFCADENRERWRERTRIRRSKPPDEPRGSANVIAAN